MTGEWHVVPGEWDPTVALIDDLISVMGSGPDSGPERDRARAVLLAFSLSKSPLEADHVVWIAAVAVTRLWRAQKGAGDV